MLPFLNAYIFVHLAFYPVFDLYPNETDSYMSISAHGFPDPTLNASQKAVGLIQPKGNGFTHHG